MNDCRGTVLQAGTARMVVTVVAVVAADMEAVAAAVSGAVVEAAMTGMLFYIEFITSAKPKG